MVPCFLFFVFPSCFTWIKKGVRNVLRSFEDTEDMEYQMEVFVGFGRNGGLGQIMEYMGPFG